MPNTLTGSTRADGENSLMLSHISRTWPRSCSRVMPSGAGHDAQSIAAIAPMGMIFAPSVGGLSHSPAEFTRIEDATACADVLLQTLLLLDRRLP